MWISKNRFQELEGRLAMAEINIRALAESKPTNRETIAIEQYPGYNSMRHLNLELKFIPSKNASVVLEPIKPDSPSEAL